MRDITIIQPPLATMAGICPPAINQLFSSFFHGKGIAYAFYDLDLGYRKQFCDISLFNKIIGVIEKRIDKYEALCDPATMEDYIDCLLKSLIYKTMKGDELLALQIVYLDKAAQEYHNISNATYDNLKNLAEDRASLPTIHKYINEICYTGEIDKLCDTRIAGISITHSDQTIPAICLAKEIKRRNPDVYVILGGAQISMSYEKFSDYYFAFNEIDALGIFAGENALYALLETIKKTEDVNCIPNIVTRANRRLVKVEYPTDLDSIEFMIPWSKESIGQYGKDAPIGIVCARGCYWRRCRFCNYQFGDQRIKYDLRGVSSIVNEIEKYICMGVTKFELIADSIPRIRLAEIAKEIIKRRLSINLIINYKIDSGVSMRELCRFFKLLKAAGVSLIYVGAEAVVDPLLNSADKGCSAEDVKKTMSALSVSGIAKVEMGFIPDIPMINEMIWRRTKKIIRSNKDIFESIVLSPFQLRMNSEYAKTPEKYAIEILGHDKHLNGLLDFRHKKITDLTHLKIINEAVEIEREMKLRSISKQSLRILNDPNSSLDKALFVFRKIYYREVMFPDKHAIIVFNPESKTVCLLSLKLVRMINYLTQNQGTLFSLKELMTFNSCRSKKKCINDIHLLANEGFLEKIINY